MSIRRCAYLGTLLVLVIAFLATPSFGTFSGTNGRISFSAFVERTRSVEIFTAKPDGSDVRRVTSNPRKASLLSDWSPDGERLAFDSDRVDIDGRKRVVQVYVMNADGTGITQLTRGPGFHGTGGWSPDGTELAIESDWGQDPDLTGIWIVPTSDPDGVTVAEARRVTDPPQGVNFDSEPQFSPDGSSIVFSRFKSARESAIYRVNADGTGLERLTSFGLNASDPDWSPDGQRITFDSGDAGRPGSKGDIYVMGADGSDRKRLTDNRRLTRNSPFKLANNPVFSPDGTKIAFTKFLPERSQLMVMNVNGRNKRVLLRKGGFPNKVDWGTHP
jgi:Tol biopolymer transport system component